MYRGVVYKYTHTLNGKVYIGQTLNERKRREKWIEINTNYAGRCINLMRRRYGTQAFTYEVLATIEMEDATLLRQELYKLEKQYIAFYHSKDPHYGYNRADGGTNGMGRVLSAQARRHKSMAQRGVKRNRRKGLYKLSEETKEKIRSANTGKHVSAIAREKIRNHPNIKGNTNRRKTVYQFSLDGELLHTYHSTYEAEEQTGANRCNISACCTGRLKHAKGYRWSYDANIN